MKDSQQTLQHVIQHNFISSLSASLLLLMQTEHSTAAAALKGIQLAFIVNQPHKTQYVYHNAEGVFAAVLNHTWCYYSNHMCRQIIQDWNSTGYGIGKVLNKQYSALMNTSVIERLLSKTLDPMWNRPMEAYTNLTCMNTFHLKWTPFM